MHVGVIGINHKSADISLRECLSKICQKRLKQEGNTILLSTCNRTEIYFSSDDLAETHSYFLNMLREELSFPFEHNLYSYFGRDCFCHLATVTSGMDSAIIGETEIQGQVKTAYEKAISWHVLSTDLHFLFQKCLKIGKEIRSKFPFSELPTLEETIYITSSKLIGDLHTKKVLIIGFSEINQKVIKLFNKNNLNHSVCNRTSEKLSHNNTILWKDLPAWKEFDLIIVGTKANAFLLEEADDIETHKVIVDLSVPRNVNPLLSRHPQITLLNLDQLTSSIDRKRKIKAEEIARVQKQLIADLIDKQIDLFYVRQNFRLALHVS